MNLGKKIKRIIIENSNLTRENSTYNNGNLDS